MSVNKISGLVNLPGPPVPISLAAGNVFMLPPGQGVVGSWGAITSPQIGLNSQMTGQFFVELGLLTCLQVYDYQLYAWRNVQVAPGQMVFVSSDGTNFRIANTTGSPVGAVITALGSGGTDGFYGYNNQRQAITIQNGVTTVGNTLFTVSTTGGALWNAIVGGQISTSINFTASTTYYQNLAGWYVAGAPSVTGNPGSGYVAAPNIVFVPPPNQGSQPYILPTATCTISGGAITAVNVVSSGAGLLGLPGILVIPQPGDTTGGGAVLGWTAGNGVEQNAGKCVALWPLFPGTAQTSVPSFTFGGTSNPGPTATAIMNFTVTSFSAGTAGVGYTNAYGVWQGGITAGSDLTGNPSWNKNISLPIFPPITVAATTALPALAGNFGGVNIQAIPSYCAIPNGTAAPSTANATTPVVGGAPDTFFLITV
jgi:hypothetical protein